MGRFSHRNPFAADCQLVRLPQTVASMFLVCMPLGARAGMEVLLSACDTCERLSRGLVVVFLQRTRASLRSSRYRQAQRKRGIHPHVFFSFLVVNERRYYFCYNSVVGYASRESGINVISGPSRVGYMLRSLMFRCTWVA